jgi:aspartyl-tRNA(Asn)/glutamyl-tRNA(Gln) amidotransferase subunit B
MPDQKKNRLMDQYGLGDSEAQLLTQDVDTATYFEEVAKESQQPKASASWVLMDVFREINEAKIQIQDAPVTPHKLAELILLIEKGELSGKMAKTVFQDMWQSKKTAEEIVKEKGLKQVSNESQLEAWVQQVLNENPSQVAELKNGKTKVMSFLMGQVMKLSKGQANPTTVEKLIKEAIQ